MINLNSDTILMGTSELRTEVPKLAKELKLKTVIITNRGKPIAVLEDFAKYQDKKEMIDSLEDLVLGKIAESRLKKSGKKDYITREKVFKMLGIKK
jgi:PHD/YefM family antitoxin component YafN of YafNO toxin-antitoxin module